ncbi:MAG TPA: HRDC domain-containing protein, partial [Verrucomicrobiae bacterium]|nr:HRDC domain-containing protein [Verrucomicrobiae bacterium]
DTEEKLAAFLPTLRAASWVAVDTEADSLHAYPEKVCLIQISTVDGDRLVDPLADLNLNPLLDALGGHELIMHGADYDLRLLEKHHKFIPATIFDTMLAARLIGLRQFGLSFLVKEFLGIELDKASQKANWAVRPLTERMERYARADTHHLKPLVDKLKTKLIEKGRYAWHQESCARLIQDCTNPEPADTDRVWRLKGSHALSRHGLAVLREVWKWRESEAVAANRPPFFILSHDALVNISAATAEHRPVEPLIPHRFPDHRRASLSRVIRHGATIPPEQFPDYVRRENHYPTEAEKKRFLDLQNHRDHHAAELDLDPTIIASRSVMVDLARDWEQYSPQLMNWQRALLVK